MINKLVLENLRHRWVRTLLSALVIGVQVMSILTLVGLSKGLLEESRTRQKGTGADIFLKPDNGAGAFNLNTGQSPEALVDLVRKQPHVAQALGMLAQPTPELLTTLQGIDMPGLEKMSGGIPMVTGHLPQVPDDLVVDRYYAEQHRIKVGQKWKLINHEFTVSGVMQGGVLGRLMMQLAPLQKLTSNTGRISQILVKLDNPEQTEAEVAKLNDLLKGNMKGASMQSVLSQFSISNIPQLQLFIRVITGLALLVGFLVVFLSMYTAVVERTREIGILKALGATPRTILDLLIRESLFLALLGWVIGICLALLAKSLVTALPTASLQIVNVPGWWPWAALVAAVGALLGAVYPGMKAARQDAIEALSYE